MGSTDILLYLLNKNSKCIFSAMTIKYTCWLVVALNVYEGQRRKSIGHAVHAGNTQLVAACWDNFKLVVRIASTLHYDLLLGFGLGKEFGSFKVFLWHKKVGSNVFPSSSQVPDQIQISRWSLSGFYLVKQLLADIRVLICTVMFKETSFLYDFLKESNYEIWKHFYIFFFFYPGLTHEVIWCSELTADKVTSLTKRHFIVSFCKAYQQLQGVELPVWGLLTGSLLCFS